MTLLRANRPITAILGALVLVGLAAGAYFALKGGGDGTVVASSFHFTATIATTQAQSAKELGDEPFEAVEAWHESGRGSRWDLRYDDPARSWMSDMMLFDGETLIHYDGKTNTYTRQQPEGFDTYPGRVPSFAFQLGPLPAPDIDAFIEQRLPRDGAYTRLNDEKLLGRDVDVVEIRGDREQVTKLWVDDRYHFVLRYEASSPETSIVASVESIEFGKDIPDERLTFVPPADAIEAPTGPSSSQRSDFRNVGNWNMAVPEGFLLPSHVPAGYVTKGTGESQDASGRITSHHIQLTHDYAAEPTLFIDQQYRAGGLDRAALGAGVVDVGGLALKHTADGSGQTLMWSQGDLVVTVRSMLLSFDELLLIAESMS